MTVMFPGNIIAHFHVNWLSPVKIRKILIGGTRLMVVYDDMEPSEKVKLYDRGVAIMGSDSVYKALVEYRTGDMFAPHVVQTEALALMAADFVDCIKTGRKSEADAVAGLNVVRLLEAADKSLKMGGLVVPLSGNEDTPSGLPLAQLQKCAANEGRSEACPLHSIFALNEKPVN